MALLDFVLYSQSSTYSGTPSATYSSMNNLSADGLLGSATNSETGPFFLADMLLSTFIDYVVVGVDYHSNVPGGFGISYTTGASIQVSNNKTTWTTLTTVPSYNSTQWGAINGQLEVQVQGTWRYVRVWKASSYLALTEFRIYGNQVVPSSPTEDAIVSEGTIGFSRREIAVSPDNKYVYTMHTAANPTFIYTTYVSAIDATTNTQINQVSFSGYGPGGVAVKQDGTVFFCADSTIGAYGPGLVFIRNQSVGSSANCVALSQDGTRAYVSSSNGTVTVINTSNPVSSMPVVATITLPSGSLPTGVAVNGDGTRVYVANSGSGTVSVINATNNTIAGTLPAGAGTFSVIVNKTSTKLYAINKTAGTISVFDISDNNVIRVNPVNTITAVGNPVRAAINPAGNRMVLTNEIGVIATYSLETDTLLSLRAIGSANSYGIAINPADTRAYITSDSRLCVIKRSPSGVFGPLPQPPVKGGFYYATSASNGAVPTHKIGDLLLAFAAGASSTFATVPAGWTELMRYSAGTTNTQNNMLVAYRFATVNNTAAGTWTAANKVVFVSVDGTYVKKDVTTGANPSFLGNAVLAKTKETADETYRVRLPSLAAASNAALRLTVLSYYGAGGNGWVGSLVPPSGFTYLSFSGTGGEGDSVALFEGGGTSSASFLMSPYGGNVGVAASIQIVSSEPSSDRGFMAIF